MRDADKQRFEHIIDYCADIEDSLNRFGRDLDTFNADRDFYNSVSMSLLQIGELAKGLSAEATTATSDTIPWNAIKGMRDHFAHGYGEMDSEIIFATAAHDIPLLRKNIEERMSQTSDSSSS
jgi:uncharacterized protein with HEPN domain